MSEIKALRRVFKMNSVVLADIDPSLSPTEVIRLYAASYPHLAYATLGEPIVQGDELVFEIEKLPVKTKGAEPLVDKVKPLSTLCSPPISLLNDLGSAEVVSVGDFTGFPTLSTYSTGTATLLVGGLGDEVIVSNAELSGATPIDDGEWRLASGMILRTFILIPFSYDPLA